MRLVDGELTTTFVKFKEYPIAQVFPIEMTISLRRKKGIVKGGL